MAIEWNMEKERQTPIKIRGKHVFIDKDIAPLIVELNTMKNDTLYSCSGTNADHPHEKQEEHRPYLVLDMGWMPKDMVRYLRCIEKACMEQNIECNIVASGDPFIPMDVSFDNDFRRFGIKVNFRKNQYGEVIQQTDEQLRKKFEAISRSIKENKCKYIPHDLNTDN